MKIKDILKEFDPNSVHIGQDIGKDFKSGSDAVKNVLDPKRWFGASPDDNAKVQASNVEVRDSLTAAAKGRLYQNNISVLQQVIANLQSGEFKSANPQGTINAIKTAIKGGQLSKQQSAELQQLAKTF